MCAGEKLVVGRGGVGERPVGSHSCEVVATLMHLVSIQGHPFSLQGSLVVRMLSFCPTPHSRTIS